MRGVAAKANVVSMGVQSTLELLAVQTVAFALVHSTSACMRREGQVFGKASGEVSICKRRQDATHGAESLSASTCSGVTNVHAWRPCRS